MKGIGEGVERTETWGDVGEKEKDELGEGACAEEGRKRCGEEEEEVRDRVWKREN